MMFWQVRNGFHPNLGTNDGEMKPHEVSDHLNTIWFEKGLIHVHMNISTGQVYNQSIKKVCILYVNIFRKSYNMAGCVIMFFCHFRKMAWA